MRTPEEQQLIDDLREEKALLEKWQDDWNPRDRLNYKAISISLASLESKPVFFIEIEGDDWINAGRIEADERPDLGLLPDGVNHLYAERHLHVQLASYKDLLPTAAHSCTECGSKSLSWDCAVINKSTVQNGLLRISDVTSLFFLGCDECSETITRMTSDEVIALLNTIQKGHAHVRAAHTRSDG